MEKDLIINTVEMIFSGADQHNWESILNNMDDRLFLDYSSLSGIPGATISAEELVRSWKDFLPCFDRTHHQLSDFQVTQNGQTARIQFKGKADHFFNADIWIVEGDYIAKLEQVKDVWKITSLEFNLSNQGGNLNLPALAMNGRIQS